MEYALFTVIVTLIIVVPFYLFRRVYYSGGFNSELYLLSPFKALIYSIIPGLILHAAYLIVIISLIPDFFSFDKLSIPISNFLKNNYFNDDIRIVSFYVFHYNLFLWFFIAFIAYFFRFSVRFLRLDRKISWLRFKNNWYYIFSGEILDFPQMPGHYKNVDFVWIDAMTKVHGDCMIYSGILVGYKIDQSSANLLTLSLAKPLRKFVHNRVNKNYFKLKSDPIKIPGDVLILPYQEIYNLNISYYSINEVIDGLNNSLTKDKPQVKSFSELVLGFFTIRPIKIKKLKPHSTH
jgi:hypothetical protein